MPYFREQRRRVALVLLLGLLSAALAALEPLILKQLVDSWLTPSGPERAWLALAALALVLLGRELLGAWLEWLTWRVRLAVDFTLMSTAIERLHSLPLAYHRDASVGATMTKIERGIAGTMGAFTEVVVRLLPSLVYLAVSAAVMLQLEWRLALAVLVFAPLPATVGVYAAREQMARERGLLERWTRLFARFNEVLSGIIVVKSFVMEEKEKRRLLDGIADTNGRVLAGVATDARTAVAKNTLATCARLLALGAGGVLVMRGEITVGTLVAFAGYVAGAVIGIAAASLNQPATLIPESPRVSPPG